MEALRPYIKHIGNCSASTPEDSSCICGLKWVFHKNKILFDGCVGVTRYIQRLLHYVPTSNAYRINLEKAKKLAGEL